MTWYTFLLGSGAWGLRLHLVRQRLAESLVAETLVTETLVTFRTHGGRVSGFGSKAHCSLWSSGCCGDTRGDRSNRQSRREQLARSSF